MIFQYFLFRECRDKAHMLRSLDSTFEKKVDDVYLTFLCVPVISILWIQICFQLLLCKDQRDKNTILSFPEQNKETGRITGVDLPCLRGLLDLVQWLLKETTDKNFSKSLSGMTRLSPNSLLSSEKHILIIQFVFLTLFIVASVPSHDPA